jgi:hypothetical protein
MNENERQTERDEGEKAPHQFVHPSCRPGNNEPKWTPGAIVAFVLLLLGIIAIQLADESVWYVVGGVALLGMSLALGWRHRALLSREPKDHDPGKLYGSGGD